MAEELNFSELSPEEMASQLRQPAGEVGVKMGLQMNKGNRYICLNTYAELDPTPNSKILEIGMGNGYFVKDLLKQADGLLYTGLDYSQTMVKAAQELNKDLVKKGKVLFKHGSISQLPFESNTFDYITTTNTLYFWPDPEKDIQELNRVIKPGGKIVIAYRSRSFLNQVELANFGFSKYDTEDVEGLLKMSGFQKVHTSVIKEPESFKVDGKELELEGLFTQGIK